MFTKLSAIGLKVRDFDIAFEFYKNVLELPVHIEDIENQFAEFVVGNSLIALLTEKTLNDMSKKLSFNEVDKNTFLIAVEVKDLEAEYKKLTETGVNFIEEPKTTPWGQKVAYFKDAEGYVWEVSEEEEE